MRKALPDVQAGHAALVLAALALFFSLGGGDVARSAAQGAKGLITGSQIKSGTIAESKLNRALRTKLARAGRVGATGPRGLAGGIGPAGPGGAAGAQGPDGGLGPQGVQGPQGTTGATGAAGSNATINGVPAGGDLAGTYPNPTLKVGAVTGAKVAPNALTGSEIDEGSLARVPNSALFDGQLPSEFLRQCTTGAGPLQNGQVFARASVEGTAVTGTFSAAAVSAGFSCAGVAPQVRKDIPGNYEVTFGLGSGGLVPLPIVTGQQAGQIVTARGPQTCGLVTCYQVNIRSQVSGGAVDGPFTIALL